MEEIKENISETKTEEELKNEKNEKVMGSKRKHKI